MPKIRRDPAAWSTAAASALCAAGAAIRCNHIADRSLWLDEAGAWRMARFPWGELLGRLRLENHPPLYFVILKAWLAAFGDSPLALRSLSVLCGVAVLAGMYLFAQEAFEGRGRVIGLCAASLACVWPTYVYWSMTARMYSLGTALTVFSSLALFRAWKAPARAPGRWLLFAALALAGAYTHYFALFTIAAQGLFLGVEMMREAQWRPLTALRCERGKGAVGSFALIAAGWLPWLGSLMGQWERVSRSWWTASLTPRGLLAAWANFALPHLEERHAVPALAAAALIAAAVLWFAARRGGAGGLYCALGVSVPFVLGVAVSARGSNLMTDAYFQFAQPYFFIALSAAGLLAASKAARRGAAVLLAAIVGLSAAVDARALHESELPPGIAAAAAYLAQNRRSGDVVISHDYFYMDLAYYLRDSRCCLLYEPDGVMPHYKGSALLDANDVVIDRAQLESLRDKRIFVVDVDERGVAPPSSWRRLDQKTFLNPLLDGHAVVTLFRAGR